MLSLILCCIFVSSSCDRCTCRGFISSKRNGRPRPNILTSTSSLPEELNLESEQKKCDMKRGIFLNSKNAHYSKSQFFVQKFNFDKWQYPNIFTSFSPKFFWAIFLVKSKLSTAKQSKTTTISRVCHPKKSTIFSRNQSLIFGQKWRSWTVWNVNYHQLSFCPWSLKRLIPLRTFRKLFCHLRSRESAVVLERIYYNDLEKKRAF